MNQNTEAFARAQARNLPAQALSAAVPVLAAAAAAAAVAPVLAVVAVVVAAAASSASATRLVAALAVAEAAVAEAAVAEAAVVAMLASVNCSHRRAADLGGFHSCGCFAAFEGACHMLGCVKTTLASTAPAVQPLQGLASAPSTYPPKSSSLAPALPHAPGGHVRCRSCRYDAPLTKAAPHG